MSDASLRELSERATPGEWHVDMFPYFDCETGEPQPPHCEGICTHDEAAGLADSIATCNEREAAFIVALVNAYRRGELHDATALTEAETRGRRDALEEAARTAEMYARVRTEPAAGVLRGFATAIRALTPEPAMGTAWRPPAGWKLVPEEADDAMREAGAKDTRADVSYWEADDIWSAMLAASPPPPAPALDRQGEMTRPLRP